MDNQHKQEPVPDQADNPFLQDDDHDIQYQSKPRQQKTTKKKQSLAEEIGPRFGDFDPAIEKVVKSGGLEFDIKLGWIPKAQITGPIPLAFSHPDMDNILFSNIPRQSLIYLGFRPTNSFNIHNSFSENSKNYTFNQLHLSKSKFLQHFFHQYYSDFLYNNTKNRQQGMLISQHPLIFDSYFQGGNLDAVYYDGSDCQEYQLVVRVDTNTRGHCMNYYFRVFVNEAIGNVRFRVVNFSKSKSLYQRGMRPYIRTRDNQNWRQGCTNVKYGLSKLCEQYSLQRKMYALKFQYEFKNANQTVQFSYGIPYTYTDLQKTINTYRQHPCFHTNKLCYSLSGLDIPIITITQPESQPSQHNQPQQSPLSQRPLPPVPSARPQKPIIALCARTHPSESSSSHITTGIIKSLLSNSPQSKSLRKKVIFKIIPMLNPDGVIIGNTRTSFAGKDLNRVYGDKIDFVFPEVIGVRDWVRKIKEKYGRRVLFFVDLHGHSTRKNSFFFGPQYPVFNQQYQKCRTLPKIFSNLTPIFRYYSCKFRLSTTKQKTCRGYFNSKNIIRTYTFQTSMHCYWNFQKRADQEFTQNILEKLGADFVRAVLQYVGGEEGKVEVEVKEQLRRGRGREEEGQGEGDGENSEDMDSGKADSQDSLDDFGANQLQMFFNRINQNREYFFEQLMQMHNIPYKKAQKTKKKGREPEQSQQPLTIQSQITQNPSPPSHSHSQFLQTWKKQTRTKSDWVLRYDFSPKKKQFLSYQKLSNVVFGGNGDLQDAVRKKSQMVLYASMRPILPDIQKNKYTIVNPILEQGLQKRNTSLQTKTSDIRRQSKSRFFNPKQPTSSSSPNPLNSTISQKLSTSKALPLPLPLPTPPQKNRQLFQPRDLQRIVMEPRNLAILGERESQRVYREEGKYASGRDGGLRSNSLRVLPRKNSIKSFRNQGQQVQKKVVKNMSQKGLANHLPYLSKLLSNL